MTQLYNVGPDLIAEPGTAGGPGFALWRPEWVSLQASSVDAQSLPTTADAFRRSLGDGAPADLSEFTALIDAYEVIGSHAATWVTSTFPAVVDLAGDVYQYGACTAPAYYPPISTEALLLERDPDDEQARSALKAILGTLRDEATEKAARAGAVAGGIADFATAVEADREQLVGVDDRIGLVRRYEVGCENLGSAADIAAAVALQHELLDEAAAHYVRDVVVAAATPTYAWVWPFGAVGEGVADGDYGASAAAALDRGQEAYASLCGLADALAVDAHLLLALHLAEVSVDVATRNVAEVLPVVLRLQSVWGGIAADLDTLSTVLDDDVSSVPALVADLHVDEAIRAWQRVAEAADAFRSHAYLRDVPGATMAAWKVATQYSSTRAAAA